MTAFLPSKSTGANAEGKDASVNMDEEKPEGMMEEAKMEDKNAELQPGKASTVPDKEEKEKKKSGANANGPKEPEHHHLDLLINNLGL